MCLVFSSFRVQGLLSSQLFVLHTHTHIHTYTSTSTHSHILSCLLLCSRFCDYYYSFTWVSINHAVTRNIHKYIYRHLQLEISSILCMHFISLRLSCHFFSFSFHAVLFGLFLRSLCLWSLAANCTKHHQPFRVSPCALLLCVVVFYFSSPLSRGWWVEEGVTKKKVKRTKMANKDASEARQGLTKDERDEIAERKERQQMQDEGRGKNFCQ